MRRLRRRARLVALSLGIVLLGFSGGMLFGIASHLRPAVVLPDPGSGPSSRSQPELSAIRAGADLVPGGTVRRLYSYSVVPGGVYSAAEAESAALADHVVGAHYSDLVLPALFTRKVTAPRAVHVSYRMGDRVYWTKNKVLLHAGESVLTDGTSEVRARCGNRISGVPQAPVLDVEPPLEELVLPMEGDTPFVAPPLLASRDLPMTPEAAPSSAPEPRGIVPPTLPPLVPPVPPPPTVVPEPATIFLLGSGLAIAAARRLRRNRS